MQYIILFSVWWSAVFFIWKIFTKSNRNHASFGKLDRSVTSHSNSGAVDSPFVVEEADLLKSYYCRPPKIAQSLIDLLDQYFDPIEREFHPSFLDLPTVQEKGIVELPETAQFILKNKRNKIKAQMRKNELSELRNTVRARVKDLKRLRAGYVETENRYKCHYTERRNEVQKHKKAYIGLLADKYGCDVKLLESRMESLYNKNTQSLMEKTKHDKKYVAEMVEWMERLLLEEDKRKKLLRPKTFKIVPRLKRHDQIVVPPPPALDLTLEAEPEYEEQLLGSSQATATGEKSSKSEKHSKSGKKKSRRSSKKSSKRASKAATKKGTKPQKKKSIVGTKKKGGKKKSGTKKSISKSPKKSSDKELDIKDELRRRAAQKLKETVWILEKLPPADPLYIIKPSCILINNFHPNVVYKRQVKLIHRTKLRTYCRPYMIQMNPDDDLGLLKLDPWEVLSYPPGVHPVVNIIFSPTESTGRLEADVIFLCRHRLRRRFTWRSFSFHITCIPPSPQITVEPKILKFPPRKIWSQDVLVDHFTVTNRGSVTCTLVVRRRGGCIMCNDCELLGENEEVEEEEEDEHEIKLDSLFCIYPKIKFGGLKEKKEKKPDNMWAAAALTKRLAAFENAETVVSSALDRLFDNIFGTFTFERKYEIEIPGRSRVRVSVAFKPRFSGHLGTVHEQWCLNFTDSTNFSQSHVLDIFAQIDTTPLYIEPLVLDMKLCLLDNGVQQQTFVVGNTGRRGYQLVISVPPAMAHQAFIHNPAPLLLGGEQVKILVRLALKYSFCAESSEFYDPSTNLLEFPIYVSSKNEEETGPALQVRVMAIVSRSMGLLTSPGLIDYGIVYTHQSAVASFHLANHSLSTHKFAFLNLPKWVMIQPGYGSGVICAGERLKFDLVYSPTHEQVAWPGGTSEHFFILIVTTLDRFANHLPAHKLVSIDHRPAQLFPEEYVQKTEEIVIFGEDADTTSHYAENNGARSPSRNPNSTNNSVSVSSPRSMSNDDPLDFNFIMPDFDELLSLYKRQSIFGKKLLPYGAEENRKSKKSSKSSGSTLTSLESIDKTMMEDVMRRSRASVDEMSEAQEVEISPICQTPDPVFAFLAVRAIVIDPFCELSAQRLILPPTAYYSYSITPFTLRCPNLQSHKLCYCKKGSHKNHQNPPKIRARYEFFSNLEFVDIEPSSGQIFTGQNLKINVIVRPRLSKTEIVERAKVLKAIDEREKRLKSRKKSSRGSRKSISGGSRRSQSVKKRGSRRPSRRSSGRQSQAGGKRKSAGGNKRKSAGGNQRKSTSGSKKKSLSRKKKGSSSKQKTDNTKKKENKSPVSDQSDMGDIVINPKDMKVDSEDLFNAKLDLMRYKESANFTTRVVCHIETELETPPYTKRIEELELQLYGTLVRPDFVVFTPRKLNQHIKFETTAVGLTRKQSFKVYNTAGRSILLNVGFFDAPDTYFIPIPLPLDQHKPNHFMKTGMWLEPDHHVTLPIIFAPKKEKTTSEYVEVRGNRTVVPLKIQGRGVEPKFKITPEFIIGKMRSYHGHPVKLKFEIENQCDAELKFYFFKLYTKEGPLYPLDPPKASTGTMKSKGGRGSKRKSLARKSVSRKSVARKSVSRKSVSRKSVSRKSSSRKSSSRSSEEDVKLQKADIKVEGRKSIGSRSGSKQSTYSKNNYGEVLHGDLISSLKTEFVPVDNEKESYMFTTPTELVLAPKKSHKLAIDFRPCKPAKGSPSAKPIGGMSARKSRSRQSRTARGKSARKSSTGRRTSKAKKSVSGPRKSASRRKSRGARKSGVGARKSGRKSGSRSSSDYLVEEEMYNKTYVAKVRLMLGAFTKVVDWWVLGQVMRKDNQKNSTKSGSRKSTSGPRKSRGGPRGSKSAPRKSKTAQRKSRTGSRRKSKK